MSTDATPTTTTAPQPVVTAYWLYIVAAVLGIIGAILLAVTLPAQLAAGQAALDRALQGSGGSTNGVDVKGVATGAAIGGVVLSDVMTLAFSILTIVFARKFLQGRNWARVVLAVFAVLQIVGAFNFASTFGVSTLHFLVAIVALILSFLPTSNAWFREQKALRTPAV